jgi:hypothetical protein
MTHRGRLSADEMQRQADIRRLSVLFVQAYHPDGKWALLERRTGRVLCFDEVQWPMVEVKA